MNSRETKSNESQRIHHININPTINITTISDSNLGFDYYSSLHPIPLNHFTKKKSKEIINSNINKIINIAFQTPQKQENRKRNKGSTTTTKINKEIGHNESVPIFIESLHKSQIEADPLSKDSQLTQIRATTKQKLTKNVTFSFSFNQFYILFLKRKVRWERIPGNEPSPYNLAFPICFENATKETQFAQSVPSTLTVQMSKRSSTIKNRT